MCDTIATLIWKDLVAETRTKEVFLTGVPFALLILVIFNFAIDVGADRAAEVGAGILWITFTFAGVLGVARSFADERDRGTLEGLLLAPIERSAVYLAKTLVNILFMAVIELVTVPAFVLLFNVEVAWLDLLVVALCGTVGFAGVGTLVAAMVANARSREVLLPLLLLPLQVPVLIASVKATAIVMGAHTEQSWPWMSLLVGYDVVLVAAAVLVFEYVVEE